MGFKKYISGIFTALNSLMKGLAVTWQELFTKKVTMQYPENRDTLEISDRWRSELIMPHDENNEHACTACGVCMRNCPNGTIKVTSLMIETEEGKKKKILDEHRWNYGSCTYCNLCVITCPSNAIIFNNDFEGAVFDKESFNHRLNNEGSKLREKKRPPKPAPTRPAVAEVKAEPEPKSVIEEPTKSGEIKENNKKVEQASVDKTDNKK